MTDSRILVISLRNMRRNVAYTALYEFEDLLLRTEGADLAVVDRYRGYRDFDVARAGFQLLRATGMSSERAFGLTPLRVREAPRKHYDLALIVVTSAFDLFALRTLFRRNAPWDRLAVFMAELWPSELTGRALALEPFDLVDEFFVPQSGAEAFRQTVGRGAVTMELGVDVMRFARKARLVDRPILANNPGRRSEPQHQRLKLAAAERGRLYLYDTTEAPAVADPASHREYYAAILGSCDLLVANYARFDQPQVIGAARSLSGRVFEGMAAGCRLLGCPPDAAELAAAGLGSLVVHPFPLDGDRELADLIDAGSAEAERAANIALAARTSDWSHRWVTILRTFGMQPGPAMEDRLGTLERLGSTGDPVAVALER